MVRDIKINVRQFTVLVILYSVGTAVLIIPSTLAEIVKQDAWIAAALGVGLGMLLVLLYNAVGNIYPEKTLVEKMRSFSDAGWARPFLLLLFFCIHHSSRSFVLYGGFYNNTDHGRHTSPSYSYSFCLRSHHGSSTWS